MKNREYKTLVAIMLTMTMVTSMLTGIHSTVHAKENTGDVEVSTAQAQKNISSAAKPVKDETVYAKIDCNGTVTSVTVSDQLRNIKDTKKIKDVSTLENIENVKGNETFSQKSNTIIWSGDSKDICYQGTTSQNLPVGVKITYKLNGKKMSPRELEGKNGHLVMRYQYENTTGYFEKDYTPFLMVTGLILDDNTFKNAKVTNGRLLSDGDREMVLGMGLPELESSLGVSNLEIPDFFELEADVTDYKAAQGITIATNEIFHELDVDKLDSLSDLKYSMNKLQDSANQLVSGSGELRKGLDALLTSSEMLADGIRQLSDGSNTLKNGASSLLSGSNTLKNGSHILADGTNQLLVGTGTLKKGTEALHAGLSFAADQTSGRILPGILQLDDGVTQMQKQLELGLSQLTTGIQALDEGATSLSNNSAYLNQVFNSGTAESGGQSLTAIATDTANKAQQITVTADGIHQTVATVSDGVSSAAANTGAAIEALQKLLTDSGDSITTEQIAAIHGAIASLDTDRTRLQEIAETLNLQTTVANGLVEEANNVAYGAENTSQIINELAASTPKLSQGASDLAAGAAELNAHISDPTSGLIPKITSGVKTLKNGTETLLAGMDGDNGLSNGLKQLFTGASQVDLGADILNRKMAETNAGAQSISDSTSQLSSGAKELNMGASALSSGSQTLQSGSATFVEGVKQLDEGAKTLNEGMIQFNEEGIKKLVNAFGGDIQKLLDKLNELAQASKNYKNFSGISDQMDGTVKFVFVINES